MPNKYLIEAVVLVLLITGGWLAWLHHDSVEQKAGAAKIIEADKKGRDAQKVIDDKKLSDSKVAYDKEISGIKDSLLEPISTPSIVCSAAPSVVRAPAVHSSPSGPAQPAHASDDVHPDISPALILFAAHLEAVNAELRRLNSETH